MHILYKFVFKFLFKINKMKKLLFITLIAIMSAPSWAQTEKDYIELERSVLQTERKAVVADAMMFTDDEATVFWPLYNEYNEKTYIVKTERVNIILDYAKNLESLSDEKADELMKRSLNVQQDLLKLKLSYYKKFKKIISPSKTVRYFQVESKIDAMVSAELALQIPLIETLK